MTQPTFEEILKQAEELAWDEGRATVAMSLYEYPKLQFPEDKERRNQLIDKATWMLRERDKAIHELVEG